MDHPGQLHAPVSHRERNPGSDFDFRLLAASPHVELIQAVPGTAWAAAPGNAVHHLGYWCDDLAQSAQLLEDNGFAFEATADTAAPDLALFAYYVDAAGTRIEIVDRALFPDFPAFLQAAAAPEAQ